MTGSRKTDPEIAQRAYSLWEEEGRPHGRDRDHWERAQRELSSRPESAASAGPGLQGTPYTPEATGGDGLAAADDGPGAAAPKPQRARKPAVPKDPAAPKRARAKKDAAEPAEGTSAAAPKRTRKLANP